MHYSQQLFKLSTWFWHHFPFLLFFSSLQKKVKIWCSKLFDILQYINIIVCLKFFIHHNEMTLLKQNEKYKINTKYIEHSDGKK